jgi:hypothetical protein
MKILCNEISTSGAEGRSAVAGDRNLIISLYVLVYDQKNMAVY